MQFTIDKIFRLIGVPIVGLALCCVPGSLVYSQSATPNPQDVPKQQAPGTNNPDIGKQRRPAPVQPERGSGDTHDADVPHQQPGTNSPDLSKDHKNEDPSAGDNAAPEKKRSGSGNKKAKKSTGSE